jgi:hypothetical protein
VHNLHNLQNPIRPEMPKFLPLLLVLVVTLLAPAPAADLESVRLNELQFLGSHNSYRLATHPPLLKFLSRMAPLLPGGLDPAGWDYSHEPLPAQFSDHGVRSVELDLYLDPEGGLFSRRQGNRLVGESVDSSEPALKAPGLKVLHFPDLDYRTNYLTFRSALTAVRDWSLAHPRHIPIIIHLETKDEGGKGRVPLKDITEPRPWDAAACDALDAEIRAVFPPGALYTPDALRGLHPTLEAAARAKAWPELRAVRGKVLFVIEGSATRLYAEGHLSLAGRASFIYHSRPGKPEAAFLLMNNPLRQGADISARVRDGFFVRTRADSDTREARTGDTRRRETAWACGAQIVSTDYYRPDPRAGKEPGWTDYVVKVPAGGPARVNPINGPENLRGQKLSD